jgi:hypothetical protein
MAPRETLLVLKEALDQHIGRAPLEIIAKAINHLADSAGFQEGDQVRLYSPTWTGGKSLKLQPSWEGPHNVVPLIHDVVYRL